MYGPFHRLGDSAEVIRQIRETGELWGLPPRNFFHSDLAAVKAYAGPLPEGARGIEFETEVAPDRGHVPGQPSWSAAPPRAGIVFDGTWAKIKVRVLRYRDSV
jgi:hypothetical protein